MITLLKIRVETISHFNKPALLTEHKVDYLRMRLPGREHLDGRENLC